MSSFRRYLLAICATTLLLTITDCALLQTSDVYITRQSIILIAISLIPGLLLLAVAWGLAIAYRYASGILKDVTARVADALQNAGIFLSLYFLFIMACSLFIYLAADTQRPLQDNTIASFDQLVGFNWPVVVERLNTSPAVAAALLFCYRSISYHSHLFTPLLAFYSPTPSGGR